MAADKPGKKTESALYIVATPIGNLGDMVPRAIETLQSVDLIAAEDTRHSARLLSHFAIDTPLVAYHDHSSEKQTDKLLQRLAEGQSLALISDAGTPLISDPGYRLVKVVREAGYRVVPIPGACALIAALSASGLPSDRFIFEGFLPAKSQARKTRLSEVVSETRTAIYYEAPHRLLDCLDDMVAILGPDREVVLARELTKTFETIRSGLVSGLLEWARSDTNQQKGEMVLLVRGEAETEASLDDEAKKVIAVLAEELPPKQASALAAKITGVKKKDLYNWVLENKKPSAQ